MAVPQFIEQFEPTESQWQSFYALFLEASGVDLNLYKADQLRRRILSSLEVFGFRDLQTLGKAISGSDRELSRLLDRLAINVTEFFRNPLCWEMLRKQVIADLLGRKTSLRCWSAGCSNGGEAYSLATMLIEASPAQHWILATDIDQAALAAAEAGRYTGEELKNVPAKSLAQHFEPIGEDCYSVSQGLLDTVHFQRHNMHASPIASSLDLIVCRNVVIYFTEAAKQALYTQFYNSLCPGGYLFVGSAERIIDPESLGFTNPWPYIYQKSV